MPALRLPRLLLALPVLVWSGWFFWLAWHRHALAWFWAAMGPVYLSRDSTAYQEQIQQSTDWQSALLWALAPLAVLGIWSLGRWLAEGRSRND